MGSAGPYNEAPGGLGASLPGVAGAPAVAWGLQCPACSAFPALPASSGRRAISASSLFLLGPGLQLHLQGGLWARLTTLCGPCAQQTLPWGPGRCPCVASALWHPPQGCLNCLRYSLQSSPPPLPEDGLHTEREVGNMCPLLSVSFKTFPANWSRVSRVGAAKPLRMPAPTAASCLKSGPNKTSAQTAALGQTTGISVLWPLGTRWAGAPGHGKFTQG